MHILSFQIRMNYSTVCTFLGLLVCCVMTLTLTGSSPVDDVEEVENQPNLRYLLSNMRHNGLSLLPPPSVYMNKLQPFIETPSKRNRYDGFWIWMPAQGYVSVPQEEAAGGASKGNGAGNVLRYG